MKLKLLMVMLVSALMVMLAGCGGPKPDVSIFVMGQNGFPSDAGEKLEASLKSKIGEVPTVKLNTSPIFSMEKWSLNWRQVETVSLFLQMTNSKH